MREGLSRYTAPFVLIFNFSCPFPDGLTLLSLCPYPYLYLILVSQQKPYPSFDIVNIIPYTQKT